MTAKIGVAISTTGDIHRIGLLQKCVAAWREALPLGSVLVITVDGDEHAARRAVLAAGPHQYGNVYRVGQPDPALIHARPAGPRLGVATNKNTGLELLMDAGVEHLFLCDDDTWPLYAASLDKHVGLADSDIFHSMVCWGKHRFDGVRKDPDGTGWAAWNWPRGVMLYTHRLAVESVGGMDERFGPGGHEHVEYSRRITNMLLTPDAFCSPASYATRDGMGARALWHAEDMPRLGEPLGNHRLRRRKLTTIHRQDGDWDRINEIMHERDSSTAFVPYRAQDNGRASATLCRSSSSEIPSQGAEESK